MFVRTKDRILEITKDTKGTKFIVFGKTLLDYHTFIKSEDDILKQADTIEELCDEFVVEENSSSKPRLLGKVVDFDYNEKKFYVKGEYSYKGIAYTLKELAEKYKKMFINGAIWTDKGLQYVAKLNSKGELELI